MKSEFLKDSKKGKGRSLEEEGKYYGLYLAKVVNVSDSENRARLKVKCPAVYGDDVSGWCLPLGMPLGNQTADFHLPVVEDTVWLQFQGGNPEYPVWTFGVAPTGWLPDKAVPGTYLKQTQNGHTFYIDEEKDEIGIVLEGGKKWVINKDTIKLGDANEPAVLGDKNELALNFIITQIETIASLLLTFTTTQEGASSSGPTAPLLSGYVSLKASITQLQSLIASQKTNIVTQTKSEVVSLE